jgi:hypothetical protein
MLFWHNHFPEQIYLVVRQTYLDVAEEKKIKEKKKYIS